MNTELTGYVVRPPVGEWVCLNRGAPSSMLSRGRPSRAAGGPPCWTEGFHGPAVDPVER
jgi:hypothetical protein